MLIDTHVFIWYAFEPDRLRPGVRTMLAGGLSECSLSAISVWELVMLHQKGRLQLDASVDNRRLLDIVEESGVAVLPVTAEIALASRTLPFQHEDPADRFIAATAIVHGALLITDDIRLRTLDWLPTL